MFYSEAVYTDIASVVRALDTQNPMLLTASVAAGATALSLSQIMPGLTIGSTLLLDMNGSNNETVTVTAINGASVACSAVLHAHPQGCPVTDVTTLKQYLAPASRFIDEATCWHGGFAYEDVTESLNAMIRTRYMVISLSKPFVDASDVQTVSMLNPDYPESSVPIDASRAWVENGYVLYVPVPYAVGPMPARACVTYKGGFKTIPADIAQATAVMAARMYKERNSGYSDVVADSATGTIGYTKAMPADVAMIVRRRSRWTP